MHGDYAWLEHWSEHVVLVGLDPDALVLMPVGVGLLDKTARRVTGTASAALRRLDYLGYALMPHQDTPHLEQYRNADIDLNQLIDTLEKQP